jgi:hypothetical protein
MQTSIEKKARSLAQWTIAKLRSEAATATGALKVEQMYNVATSDALGGNSAWEVFKAVPAPTLEARIEVIGEWIYYRFQLPGNEAMLDQAFQQVVSEIAPEPVDDPATRKIKGVTA